MYQECTRNPGRKVPGMYQECTRNPGIEPGIYQESTRNPGMGPELPGILQEYVGQWKVLDLIEHENTLIVGCVFVSVVFCSP